MQIKLESSTKKENDRERLITEIYEVVLKPERFDQFMMLWDEHISMALSDLDDLKKTPPNRNLLDDPELEAHFKRAYEILEKLGREGSGAATPQSYSEQNAYPTFFVAKNGRIIDANSAAMDIIGYAKNLVDIAQHTECGDYKKLKKLVSKLESPQSLEQVSVLRMNVVTKDNGENKSEHLFLAKPMKFQREGPTLLCIYAMNIVWSDDLRNVLLDAFSMTGSEMEIAEGLCSGKSLAQISIERNRSIHTIRTQVKSLIQKSGTSSQSDLVRVILTLASFGNAKDQQNNLSLKRLDAGQRIEIKVGNNLIMPVHIIGPEDGRPVLFLHGMLDGAAVSKAVGIMLQRLNIKLVAPTRPSFGDCPPAYNIATAPEEFAHDLKLIMDELNIKSAPIIGHMAGSIYAFAAAAMLKHRISAIISVSGGVPIKSVQQFKLMSPRQRIVAWTARFTPALLPSILRSGISQIDSGDEEYFMNALFVEDTCDRRATENLNIRAAIHAGYRFAVAQGHRAFEVDSRHVTRDWSSYVEATRQPVTLLHGVHDPVVAIDTVRDFACTHDRFELIEHDDAGQLIFYQKPEMIFSIVENYLDAN
ncbi:MAG: alpha/beta fold hydrolase [Rhizobiaceae bacterium]